MGELAGKADADGSINDRQDTQDEVGPNYAPVDYRVDFHRQVDEESNVITVDRPNAVPDET
jgi:hypothetical protein